jgi:hypothetical protein
MVWSCLMFENRAVSCLSVREKISGIRIASYDMNLNHRRYGYVFKKKFFRHNQNILKSQLFILRQK